MTIDLRSDTVTRPDDGMRQAMAQAEVGDDVLGDDPTVQALEQAAAARVGKEAAAYVPSGTMANLMALLTHCGRGDEAIVGSQSHVLHHEGTGAPALGGVWLIGRVIYMFGYMSEAAKRGPGAIVTMVANAGLLILAVIGLVG